MSEMPDLISMRAKLPADCRMPNKEPANGFTAKPSALLSSTRVSTTERMQGWRRRARANASRLRESTIPTSFLSYMKITTFSSGLSFLTPSTARQLPGDRSQGAPSCLKCNPRKYYYPFPGKKIKSKTKRSNSDHVPASFP